MLWYIGSLIVFSIFFYVVVHIFALPHGTTYFILLFLLLGGTGLSIIYTITRSISYLSHRIKHISRRNLDERILDIQSSDEIGDLASSFNSLLDRINEAFKREQQFIADVAHELKTPLATMNSSIEITLTKERSNEAYKQILKDTLNETKRLSSMLKNVLDLAWSETHDEQKKTSRFNLSELLEELVDISEKMAEIKHITIRASIPNNLFMSGFRDKLARALLNIIDNSIKYTHTGTITIRLRKNVDHAVLTISDTGQGIHPEDMPHIFSRFFRGSKTERIGGSGLGLAISKSIISLHGGTIIITSKRNEGTLCTIRLPLAR